MKALAIVRDVLLIVALLSLITGGALIGYGVAHRGDPRPAPSSTEPTLPDDRCGGGMCAP